MSNERCCKGTDYAVYRITPNKFGNGVFLGTVYAESQESAEAKAHLIYPVLGNDYLEVEKDIP